ncbi:MULTISPECIES: ABC transporter substrate-binding protein [unclassified Bartonella]|uniref:ABC transporter substrate-binding protein n=1 Tax=unclassified Bartonella TaxID=2645622 RepID=UPI0015FC5661|nr:MULTISPECIES: transporter substrate-binding domain-containing protein [unclassified Bartonella]UXN07657.1 transporter substrate-binding domain-containing protein [Bartonella sp. HY761]
MKHKLYTAGLAASLLVSSALMASADKLDDIISSGTLRCAVTLDFPPMGSRDDKNTPIGFDVDYCGDLAKALGVKVEIVETPFPDRVPALMSDRADVVIASTSDTLERAKVVGFSVPYMVNRMVILTREETGINTYEDLKGRKLGNTASTFEEGMMKADIEKWGGGAYSAYQSQNDTILAVAQGHIEASVLTESTAQQAIKTGNYPNLVIKGVAPYVPDYYGIATKRQEYGLINYLNLFVHQQVRTGRYQELYTKWFNGDAPSLIVEKTYR